MPALVFEKKDHTAYVFLNRPEQKNAINLEMRRELRQAWQEVEDDPEIFSVIVSGGEAVFSVGQDLHELERFKQADPLKDLPLNTLETFGSQVKKPVIAAISGFCLGYGFLLTMVGCDLRVGSTSARFGMPEVKVGVPPSLGIPAYAARFSPGGGHGAAAHRQLSIRRSGPPLWIPQPDGSPPEVLAEAEKIARSINAFSPFMVRNIKRWFGSP